MPMHETDRQGFIVKLSRQPKAGPPKPVGRIFKIGDLNPIQGKCREIPENENAEIAENADNKTNMLFEEPVVCTADSRGFRHFCGFHYSSTQLLVCSCLRCPRRFRDFHHFRERLPACKPYITRVGVLHVGHFLGAPQGEPLQLTALLTIKRALGSCYGGSIPLTGP